MKNDQNKSSNKQTDACNEKKATKSSAYFFNTMYMLIKTEIYSFQMNFDHQNGYYKWSQTFEKSFAY